MCNMRENPLQVIREELNLGVTIYSDLEYIRQWKSACINAHTMLGFTAENFMIFKASNVIIYLDGMTSHRIHDAVLTPSVQLLNHYKDC